MLFKYILYKIFYKGLDSMTTSHFNVLINRYISYINDLRPDIKPIKNKEGSLELSHSLWMLLKMKNESFVPKTSPDAWISWIQASLYLHGLIEVRHEIDITREILKQEKQEKL